MKRVLLIALMIMFFGVVLFSSFSLGNAVSPKFCGCYPSGRTCVALYNQAGHYYSCPANCSFSNCMVHPPKQCGCYPSGQKCVALYNQATGHYNSCPANCSFSNCMVHPPKQCGCYPSGQKCVALYNQATGHYNSCPTSCSSSNCMGGTPSGGGTIPATLVTVEGKLINENGPPISGQVSMKFEFYSASTGGVPLSVVSGSSVNITDGFFNVEVPIAKTPSIIGALVRNQLYVQIYVNGNALNPRIRITPSVSSIASEYLDVYTAADFVKRAGDTMLGDLNMGLHDLLGINNVQAQTITSGNVQAQTITSGNVTSGNVQAQTITSGNVTSMNVSANTIYENGMRLEDKYMVRNKAFGMFENIWCNHLHNCYYYTTRSKPVDVVYGRIGLGNFNASEIKQGFVRFPQSLPSTPVVVASIESCTGMFNVNLQGPSKYGFFVRVKNLENYSTSCGGGIFLNFIAVTYGGQNKQSASILQGWTTYQPNTMTCYKDNDNDGYGNPNNSITTTQSSCPSGYVSNAGDCNDNDSSINPGASETYDGIDDNCDGSLGPGECASNADCSSYPGICDTSTHKCEVQCGIDNDGDGYIHDVRNFDLSCPSGWTQLNGPTGSIDCNDNNPSIHPGAQEIYDGIDDNCDGSCAPGECGGECGTHCPSYCTYTPQGGKLCTYYTCNTTSHHCELATMRCGLDNDGDGWYGNISTFPGSCPPGWKKVIGNPELDCNDNNPNIHPGVTDVCNGVDDDCDGTVDEDASCPTGEECINGSCQSVSGGGDHNPPHPPECQAGEDKCT